MCKFDRKNKGRLIDPCMKMLIYNLRKEGIETLSCCCGHGKYPMSIIIKDSIGLKYDLCSGIFLFRKERFYRRDKSGRYYIPEVLAKQKQDGV